MSKADIDIASFEQNLSRIAYAKTLGVKPVMMDGEFTLVLPYLDENVGNPLIRALHGGVIGGFMEITAISQLILTDNLTTLPKPIGINIDYLRRGKPVDTYARALVFKQGRRVSNVRVTAWQEDIDKPIAALHGHFLGHDIEA